MEKEIKLSIRINATPEQVWNTLTNPEKIAQYMYGAIAKTTWKPGDSVDYYMLHEGQEMHVVKGRVIRAEAPFYLEHTLFPVGWTIADIPENYLTAIYEVEELGQESELTVIQRDYTQIAEGEKRYQDSLSGWEMILPKIKEVAES